MRKNLLIPAAVGFLLVAAFFAVLALAYPKPVEIRKGPNPNGYDDFLSASGMLASPQAAEAEPSQASVAQNVAALRLAREGLGKECVVNLNLASLTNQMITNIGNHLTEISKFKALGQAFIAEGKLAERSGKFDNAARSYLDTIHFGHECCRGGGMIIDLLVGLAIQSMGCHALEGTVSNLTLDATRTAIQDLQKINSRTQPLNEVFQSERTWSRKYARATYGWRGPIVTLFALKQTKTVQQRLTTKFQAQQAKNKLLLTKLAAHASELEDGHPK